MRHSRYPGNPRLELTHDFLFPVVSDILHMSFSIHPDLNVGTLEVTCGVSCRFEYRNAMKVYRERQEKPIQCLMLMSAAAFTFQQVALDIISSFQYDLSVWRNRLKKSDLDKTQLFRAGFYFDSLKMIALP